MDRYEQVIELAKRRGFLWNSFELYGGVAGFYDYGPLGSTLKRRIEDIWRDIYVINEGFFEIECPTIGIEEVFLASGHLGGFSDPLCECKECGEAYRADHLVEGHVEFADGLKNKELDGLIEQHDIVCPECGGKFGCTYEFNLMFKTSIGPGEGRKGYMRPETAQGIFIDFQRLARYYREKLPFGATQIGKSFRNEISPRQGVIRLREFTQAEAEIFIDPKDKSHPYFKEVEATSISLFSCEAQESGTIENTTIKDAVSNGTIAHEFLGYQLALTQSFLLRLGIKPEYLRFRQHKKDEMAHYAIDCWDAEIKTDRFGWIETVGIADRTDYDLKAHSNVSNQELSIYVEYDEPITTKEMVIKPNMGKLGPIFKGKAKKVAEAIKGLSPKELDKNEIRLEVDGEVVVVSSDLFTYSEQTVKVSGENIIPHVIEPSFGIDRILYCTMEHAFESELLEGSTDNDSLEDDRRNVLKFKPEVAPLQVAVLPLLTRNELIQPAREIIGLLRRRGLMVDYDVSGTIGRRYRRNDEIGTPYSVTIDYQTLEDNTVTVRDRDSMDQIRVDIVDLSETLYKLIKGDIIFSEAGELVT